MKAAVMKIEGKKAIVMLDDGSMQYIRNNNYSVGEELEITAGENAAGNLDRIIVFTRRNMPVVAAAAAFVIMLSGGLTIANTHENSVVTLDINPSLKYSLNVFDKVIDMDSYNDDGAEIVSKIAVDVKGKNLENAVKQTLDELDRTGYVGENTAVVVTLNSKTKSEDELETQVMGSVDNWNEEKSLEDEGKSIDVETVKVTPQMADSAEDKNVSPGKIYIVGKLKEQVLEEVEFDEDEWLDKSVKEIEEAAKTVSNEAAAKAISENKKAASGNTVIAAKEKESSAEAGVPAAVNDAYPPEEPAKTSSKKNKKKKVSSNTGVSTNEGGASTEGEGGGSSLSGDAVSGGVSENQPANPAETVSDPSLVIPSISGEPEEQAAPVETETVTVENMELQTVDQLGIDSSYLEIPQAMDAMCDSVPAEDSM